MAAQTSIPGGRRKMTTAGWVFMIVSWAGIIALIVFSYSKILSAKSLHKK